MSNNTKISENEKSGRRKSTLETATESFLDLDIEKSLSAQKETQKKLQSLKDQRAKN